MGKTPFFLNSIILIDWPAKRQQSQTVRCAPRAPCMANCRNSPRQIHILPQELKPLRQSQVRDRMMRAAVPSNVRCHLIIPVVRFESRCGRTTEPGAAGRLLELAPLKASLNPPPSPPPLRHPLGVGRCRSSPQEPILCRAYFPAFAPGTQCCISALKVCPAHAQRKGARKGTQRAPPPARN